MVFQFDFFLDLKHIFLNVLEDMIIAFFKAFPKLMLVLMLWQKQRVGQILLISI